MAQSIDYFSDNLLHRNLKRKTIRGGAYTVVSQVLRALFHLLAIPILARLLDPSDFGLIAMTAVVVGLAGVFVDGGFTAATIQSKRLTPQQSTNMFWVSTAMGLIVTLAIAAIAPLVVWFYGEPRLLPITMAMGTAFIFSGLTIQHQALLRRCMQFGRLAVVQVVSVAIGQAAAIAWAWYYRNVWALVVMSIAMALSRAVLTWAACPWRPGLPQRRSGVRSMVFFGGNVTGSSIANYMSSQVERLFLGPVAGTVVLGSFDQAWRLLTLPLLRMNAPFTAVAVPALSRRQDRALVYRDAYLKALIAIAILPTPFIALSLAAPDWLILTVLGDKFQASIPIFQVLAIGAATLPLSNAMGWLFVSQGRVAELLRIQVTDLIVKVILIAIGIRWGVMGVAWATTCRYFFYSSFVSTMAGRCGPVARTDLWSALGRSALIVAAGYLAARFARELLPSDANHWQGLIVIAIPCCLTCLVASAAVRSVRELFFEGVQYISLLTWGEQK